MGKQGCLVYDFSIVQPVANPFDREPDLTSMATKTSERWAGASDCVCAYPARQRGSPSLACRFCTAISRTLPFSTSSAMRLEPVKFHSSSRFAEKIPPLPCLIIMTVKTKVRRANPVATDEASHSDGTCVHLSDQRAGPDPVDSSWNGSPRNRELQPE